MMYGNLDSNQEFEFPVKWSEDRENVVVHQEALVEIYGKISPVEHPIPVQVYPRKIFKENFIIPEGAKRNGFADLGLKVTPLHDADKKISKEEAIDIQIPAVPVAETGETTATEIIHKAVEAVENGTGLTAAENFTEMSKEKAEEKAEELVSEGKELAKEAVAENKDAQKASEAAPKTQAAKPAGKPKA